MAIAADLVSRFKEVFGTPPRLFQAPGRVNLIGEHTDYNDGLVMPAAIDLSTLVAIAPRADRRLRIHSTAFAQTVEFDLDEPSPSPRGDWTDYVRGVTLSLKNAGHTLIGADLMMQGDLPMGSGLSASAALEVASGYALCAISGVAIDLTDLALYCQAAENEFVGMRCGVMDQFICCRAVAGYALLLDCRSLESRRVRIDPRVRLVICNTMVRHELANSAYNERREECERAVVLLSSVIEGVKALRDVTLGELTRFASLLPDPILRRARHVVTENARVLQAAMALAAGDLGEFGALMGESHLSLRDDYEVSCPELDLMVALARGAPGVYGARMTGAGFGGCTVNLVETRCVESFRDVIARSYRDAIGLTPQIFCCAPEGGVGEMEF
jgi:galactokinase